MIKVYNSNETLFENNGIKILHPLVADITKKDNSDYYVELKDILDNLEYYQKGMIIRISTPWGVQGFRCDNPKVKNNRVECKAWHLSYDSKNYIIKDANAVDKNCNDALDHFNRNTDKTSPFKTISDITKNLSTRGIRKSLFEIYEWFISEDKYGGHWDRDNFTLGIRQNIGQDKGVVLSQNKNITNIQISENWDDVCTKILPYTTDGETAILLDDTYVENEENLYDIPYTKVIKFENQLNQEDYSSYEEFLIATKSWLKKEADNYLENNKLPKINYSVSAKIDNISDVGDVIYIKHPKCKVDIQTNVIGIVYDAIRKSYIKIEFGNFKKEIKNLTQEITSSIKKDTEILVNENTILLQKELTEATNRIKSVMGNSFVINTDGSQILIVDKLPKEEAKYCIRINSGGIGFSSTGINGVFNSAWTIDGTLDMQNVNVINLVADMIQGGTLKLGGENNTNGSIEIYDANELLIAKLDKDGIQFNAFDELSILNQNLSNAVNSQATEIDVLTSNQKALDDKQVQSEKEINNVKGTIDTLSGKVAGLKYNVVTNSLEIADRNSKINSTFDNTGVKVYNYDKLSSIFTDKGTGIDKLIVTGTSQMSYLKIAKANKGIRKNKKCTQIFVLDNLIEKLVDLESE